MKRTSVVLLASGALVAAVTGTALAGGGDDASPSSGSSSASASATPSSSTSAATPTAKPTPTPSMDDTAGATATMPAKGAVSSRHARAIALSHVGGGSVTKVEAEMEHGRAVWSVRIVRDGARYDVDVDANTGEVTRSRGGARGSGADSRRDDHGDVRDDRSGADDHGARAGADHERGDDRSGHRDDGTSDDRHGGDGDGHGRHGRHHD
ncbi:PepSY domain-containing protein [Streptomyces sp. NPDC086783]|uniref:PepSY domain-containing protein n=1 Tax=Streptomyces sp. NPDC086783 TaxID=3365758 RepID=UPI00380D36A4